MNITTRNTSFGTTTRLLGVSALALISAHAAYAQSAPASAPAAAAPVAAADGGDIVVTGFRASLDKALNLKRLSVGSVDAIIAEDIAKFPDQNLAESLQRIPGIAVNKDGGEGREITVRGLAGQFTTIRVNGLEAQAATFNAGSGGGNNRERAFDFNMFASELFRSLIVHKTAESSLDEGSLGAVVDLNTGHPLGAKAGLHGALSAQAYYNDLSQQTGPKASGLLNWRNTEGTIGINASAAYSHTQTLELGNNTTGWQQSAFNSVTTGGVKTSCFTATTGLYVPSASCDQAALAFHARIPRYGITTHDRERLGMTGAIEWQPNSKTHVEIDGLYSRYHEIRTEKWLEVLFRNNEGSIDVVNPVYDANNNMVSGTFNNAWNRQENFLLDQRDSFYQVSGKWDQQLTDRLKATALVGISKSDENIPIQTTVMLDNISAKGVGASQGYSYDYTNMQTPVLTYGAASDPTNPNNYQFTLLRDRPQDTSNQYKTGKLDLDWKLSDNYNFKTGAFIRQFDFVSVSAQRDAQACSKAGVAPNWGPGTAAVCTSPSSGYALSANPALTTDLVTLSNEAQPAGTSNSFVVLNLPAAAAFSGLYSRPALQSLDPGNNRNITELEKGAYFQVDGKGELFHLKFAYNAGMRYIKTNLTTTALSPVTNASNVVQLVPTTVTNSYDNLLPSANLTLFATKTLILRAAAAKVMTRPSISDLSPGVTVNSSGFTITINNPYLQPSTATNYDLGLEWYFAPQSIFSMGVFSKEVANAKITTTTRGTFASTGLPTSILAQGTPVYNAVFQIGTNPLADSFLISSFTNAQSSQVLKGLEMGLQAPFRFLPGIGKHFGFLTNMTLTDSSAPTTVVGADTVTIAGTPAAGTKAKVIGGPQAPASTVVNLPFPNASKLQYNLTLYYEDSRFGARMSYAYRGTYYDAVSSTTGNITTGFGPTKSVDASLRYTLMKRFDVTLDATNLLDGYVYRFSDNVAQRNYDYSHFGRTFTAGARYKF
jgi:iron complex outermembrane recepter protein